MPDNIRTGQTYYTSLQLGQPKTAILVPIGGFFRRQADSGSTWSTHPNPMPRAGIFQREGKTRSTEIWKGCSQGKR
ncbi:MAG: hypothetical protein MZV63_03065 [Marinilabiliales bacterium]|nr:hypothetical protein [Marinilabiliales bacterium]